MGPVALEWKDTIIEPIYEESNQTDCSNCWDITVTSYIHNLFNIHPLKD